MEGSDICEFCKMTVMENKYAAEFVTVKGKYYVFDDIHCMTKFMKENPDMQKDVKNYFVSEYNAPENLINAEHAFYFTSDELHTPMNGNTIAVETKASLEKIKSSMKGEVKTWPQIIQ